MPGQAIGATSGHGRRRQRRPDSAGGARMMG